MAETYAERKLRELKEMREKRFTFPPVTPKVTAPKREVDIRSFITPEKDKPYQSTVGGVGVIPAPKTAPLTQLPPSFQGASPVPKSRAVTPTVTTAAKGLTELPSPAVGPPVAGVDQTAPVTTEGIEQLPKLAPAPEAPAESTLWEKAKGGIASIGKWAEDPKIARALMTAGLSTLATEPRRVPYSDAEMLGRAGLTGIGAFDTEVAKEAAAKEMARKAGLEERKFGLEEKGVGLQERQVKMAENKAAADAALIEWQKTHPKATVSRLDVGDQSGYGVFDEHGKLLQKVMGTETQRDGGRGGIGGVGGDMENAAQKAAQAARVDHLKEFPSDIEGANVAASSAYDDYMERPTTRTIPGTPEEPGGWFFKGTPAGPTIKESRGSKGLAAMTTEELLALQKKSKGVR